MLSTKLRLFPDHRAGRPAAPGDEARGGRGLPPVTSLLLKRASTSRPSGEWNDEDYDVLADGGAVVGIFKVHAAPVGTPWMWTLAFGHHEDRIPTHGYEPTREAAMAASRRAGGGAMAKTTTPLTAHERVILFCTAPGVSHVAVGITGHAMQSMAIKGFIVHDSESGAYALTDSGRAALLAMLGDAGLTQIGPRGGSNATSRRARPRWRLRPVLGVRPRPRQGPRS